VRQVGRFRLAAVETDVLKILYESLVDPAERHDLGEYYTPDWLSAKICRSAIKKPLTDRVVDPACGSGTFLFHAVRLHLAAAANARTDPKRRAQVACTLIAGIDIHPVAIIIARVTFLLALGDTLVTRAGGITVPVYLGDSLQLNVRGMFMGEELVVIVPPPKGGEREHKDLHFPKSVCEFPELFDEVLETMRVASEGNMRAKAFEARIKAVVVGRGKVVPDFDLSVLRQTYEKLDVLHKEGRDTIWSYVARNLSRPVHLSSAERRADVVVGNPPWLAFRHMSKEFQKRFKEMAEGERVYVGGKLATQADLSALFFAKSVALYLREGGRIAFVMPLATLTRGQFANFRTGAFHTKKVQFTEAWTFDEDVQPLFPVPSCVLFAAAERGLSRPTPKTVTAYTGKLPLRDAHEDVADKHLKVTLNAPAPSEASYEGGSPYRAAFVNGATLYPRMLCLVEKPPVVSRLGSNPGAPFVKSRKSAQDKPPWKSMPGLDGQIEAEFLRSVYLGESILPFRAWKPVLAVIPVSDKREVLNSEMAAARGYLHLYEWMHHAETLWSKYGSGSMNFAEQLDYYGKLASQFPIPKLRVVYAKAGTLPAAAIIDDNCAVVDPCSIGCQYKISMKVYTSPAFWVVK
jgi:Eco57I restriction-modification methylase